MINLNEKLINTIIDAIDWNQVYDPKRAFSEDDPSAIVESLPINIDLRTGASKCVLIPANDNFVIKIPFLYCSQGEDMIELRNAPFAHGSDYCYAEYEYYSRAYDANVDMFFPETTQYCTYPYHIYLQEKCITESDAWLEPMFNHNLNTILSLPENLLRFSNHWLDTCITQYGESALYNLSDFLNYYNLSDFHADNYGYRKSDGSPVLIDFSDFQY